ncbi:MAG: AMP-binding protein [Hyphomicrobiaceae bacterium]
MAILPDIECTIGDELAAAVDRYHDAPLLIVPRDPDRDYDATGRILSYEQAQSEVARIAQMLKAAGYGHGHRIAVLLENRIENLLVKLACAVRGVSWVPVNPDYRPAEIAYLLQDSGADLALTTAGREELMRAGLTESGRDTDLMMFDASTQSLSRPSRPQPLDGLPSPKTESSLLYTSGTTGRPKGCIVSHAYELMIGKWYATRGGLLTMQEGAERIYNPLPLFHINSSIFSFFAAMQTGNCQILPERFSRTRWWRDIRETEATIIHYLGAIVPVLLSQPPGPRDRDHKIKFGMGGGVEPTVHREFEERFGFPLIEGWAMTESCRMLAANEEPRHIDTRAIGRPQPGLEVRVVDDDDNEVPVGQPGEMLVRHSAETPRHGAFSGYLNQPEATDEGWRGGWWHTGDTVHQDETGMIYFVDRKKNIIRRSGENVAAAEVEACLQGVDVVAQVAVLAVPDEVRDEEVMACVVLAGETPREVAARRIFDHAYANLAYYKAPGWIALVEALPVTGTQKVLKHMIFKDGKDPLSRPNTFDFRELKKRA